MAFTGTSSGITSIGIIHPGLHCSREEREAYVEVFQTKFDELGLGAVSRGRPPKEVIALPLRDLSDPEIKELEEKDTVTASQWFRLAFSFASK